jgi:hypothetical protein
MEGQTAFSIKEGEIMTNQEKYEEHKNFKVGIYCGFCNKHAKLLQEPKKDKRGKFCYYFCEEHGLLHFFEVNAIMAVPIICPVCKEKDLISIDDFSLDFTISEGTFTSCCKCKSRLYLKLEKVK